MSAKSMTTLTHIFPKYLRQSKRVCEIILPAYRYMEPRKNYFDQKRAENLVTLSIQLKATLWHSGEFRL